MKKYYVTTPIYYVNDAPHIGSTYTTLAADIIARYYREKLGKDNVFFLTGTDEHGQKIAESAKKNNQTPIEFADSIVPKFKEAWKLLNINYDYFIRTTDPRHEKIASDLLQKLHDKGYIYPGTYEGPYCVGCERYYKESELLNNRCPLHPDKDVSYQKERNYFFKLKEVVENEVLPKIKNSDYKILPEIRKNEVLARIEQGVEDISISREGVTWGIPLPWDKNQTCYVWVEALMNYYSATRFLENKEIFWPADLHLMAKDILWFHAVIWEAILIAAEIELPKTIFAHGFFTRDGQKMSKSLGNVITPQELVDKYGVDGSRYLLISAVAFGTDGDISLEAFDQKYNADLANGLGNLVSRVTKLAEKSDFEFEIGNKNHFDKNVAKHIENYRFDEALKLIWQKISDLDKKTNEIEPWKLEGKDLRSFLQESILTIRHIAYNLQSFMPQTAEKILDDFKGPKIKSVEPLFPRI
jgi:methionyl-tRNA synthetase